MFHKNLIKFATQEVWCQHKNILRPQEGKDMGSGNHMIKCAGKLNPWFSCHVFPIVKIEPDRQ